MNELWRSVNYKTPIKYFANTYIREYDLSKANINSLLYKGRITLDEHTAFMNMSKDEREIKIGLWIKRDSSVYKDIQEGILTAKRLLVESNNIEEYDIVSIKNDAVFVVGKELSYTEFPPFLFNLKNVYTVYMQLQDLEIYYGDHSEVGSSVEIMKLDVKGVSEDKLFLHSNGMLGLIGDVCYRIQRESIKGILDDLIQVYEDFIHRRLPKDYYRNLDAYSGYLLNTFTRAVLVDDIDDDMVYAVDINRNLSILRDLISIVTNEYNINQSSKRR